MSIDVKDLEAEREERTRPYDPYAQVTIGEFLDDLADRREKCPMSWSPDGEFWVATKYADISSVMRRNNRGFVSFPNIPDGTLVFGQKRQIPIELDGPIHKEYRRLLDPLFAPGQINPREDQIRAVANDLIDEFIESGHCDIIPQFAFPLPGTVFLSIMDWPLEDAPQMNAWVHAFLHGVPGGTQEETDAARAEASEKSRAYIQRMVDERRANPGDDITSMIVTYEMDGAPISDEDLSDLFVLMMMAGLDTVQSVIAQSMNYFAAHQDQWTEMFSDPELIDPAIEELLRWTSPAVPTRSVADETATVADLELKKGERVHCPLAAANRDPEQFPNPDEVDFHREAKPHLTFGMGTHRCVGLHLARKELRIAFEELHKRIPSFALEEGCEPREHLALTWGVEDVRIVFEPGERLSAA